jgi:hypothetical protein
MSSLFARRYQTVQDIKPLSVEEILQLNPKDVKTNPILNDANFKEDLTMTQQKAFRTFAAYKRTSIPITKTTIRNYIKENKEVDNMVFDTQIEHLNDLTFQRRVVDLTRARGTKKKRKGTKGKRGKTKSRR